MSFWSDTRDEDRTWESHVNEALEDVKRGQHLRFINPIYRTKEVCLAALRYQSFHTNEVFDILSVPPGNLDYVINNLRCNGVTSAYLLRNAKEIREHENKPGYYGDDCKSLQELLDKRGVKNVDEMYKQYYYKQFGPKNANI